MKSHLVLEAKNTPLVMESEHHQIADLQVLLMEHERQLEHYSDLILGQQKQIDQLKFELEKLKHKLDSHQEPGEADAAHQLPPHY